MRKAEREKGSGEMADLTAVDVISIAKRTKDLKLSSDVCFEIYQMMTSGQSYKDDKFVNGVQLAVLWNDGRWWQLQIDLAQLAQRVVEDSIKDSSKVYAELSKNKKKAVQADMYGSFLEMEKGTLDHYKVWEQVCINSMRRIAFVKRAVEHGQIE